MLDHLARMVTDAGYQPMTASNWTDALKLFREERPDLILLDVMMPTVDGYKLARIIKGDSSAFVPIILLTALDDLESKRRGMASGADDFLTKPVMSLELQIRVSSMLRIKQLTDELHSVNLQLEKLATTDALTGLANRRSLYTQLEREFARAKRYGRAMSAVMIDVDHFKQVNDNHGHPVGDRVLRVIGDVLRASIRTSDFAGRFGGEEFLVLATETGRDTIGIMAERIRATVASTTASAPATDGLPHVTVSLGIATSDLVTATSHDELLRYADDALYQAKRGGRNRYVIHD